MKSKSYSAVRIDGAWSGSIFKALFFHSGKLSLHKNHAAALLRISIAYFGLGLLTLHEGLEERLLLLFGVRSCSLTTRSSQLTVQELVIFEM